MRWQNPAVRPRQNELRERNKQEKQQEKRVERAMRKEMKRANLERTGLNGEDPDLIGIIPGPQPPLEF